MSMTGKDLAALLKKNPVSVTCGALALVLAAATYFRSDGLPAAQAQLDQLSREGTRLDANIQNAVQLREQVDALKAADKKVEARIVHAGELAKNLQYFYKLEADTGTKLSELRQSGPSTSHKGPKTIFTGIGYSFGVQGDYPALLDFLRRLEHGAYFCRVITANVAVGNDVDRTGPLKLNVTLELLGVP